MARRGSATAVLAARELLRDACGWHNLLLALDAAGGPALLDQVVDGDTLTALVSRVAPNELLEATQEIDAPWAAWAEAVPAVRFVLRRQGEDLGVEPRAAPIAWVASKLRGGDEVIDPTLPSEALLAQAKSGPVVPRIREVLETRDDPDTTRALLHAAREGTPVQRGLALRILGARGRTDFLADAERALRHEAAGGAPGLAVDRGGWFRYLDALPCEVTLPLARAWFDEPWPLSHAAESILARHATADDRERLQAAGELALRHDLVYRLCSVVDALAHIGDPRSLPLLIAVYEQTRYSYARRRAVRALTRHEQDDRAHDLLIEALWDCEPESRELACRTVDRDALPVRGRLRDLAADPCEDEDVRAAAAGPAPAGI
jgi:hypothetical protein